jgi:hypothetical protein
VGAKENEEELATVTRRRGRNARGDLVLESRKGTSSEVSSPVSIPRKKLTAVHFFLREDLRVAVEAAASGTFFFEAVTLCAGPTPAAVGLVLIAGRAGVDESEREDDVDAVGDI